MKNTTKLGKTGEQLVAQWLERQGWNILHSRWHCPWGEIDLIAQKKTVNTLIFVEVKTRSQGNWDADGLLAISLQKQEKICCSAEYFLSKYPELADLFCRFDVALVNYSRVKKSQNNQSINSSQIGNFLFWREYQFTLKKYIESAFYLD